MMQLFFGNFEHYSHHLPIESGRWINIPRHDQDLCSLKLTQNRRLFALYTKLYIHCNKTHLMFINKNLSNLNKMLLILT